MIRDGERVKVLVEDEIVGANFVIDKLVEAENILVEADKMKIVEVRDGKTYLSIVDVDSPSVEGDKIFELKNVSDKVVKHDTTLFREIQDTSVLMTQRAYNIIRTTEDGALRQMGINKIELMNKSKGGRIALEKFDRGYNASQIRF